MLAGKLSDAILSRDYTDAAISAASVLGADLLTVAKSGTTLGRRFHPRFEREVLTSCQKDR
jgi:hypothetical protein